MLYYHENELTEVNIFMALREYSTQLEVGGLLLAIMEFLGVGKIVDQFVIWQTHQLRLFVRWYRGDTEIKALKSEVSNINYIFILFVILSGYSEYVYLTVNDIPITWTIVLILIGAYILLYFFFLKVLLPLLEVIVGAYSILISLLTNKGALALIGILIALAGFIISQTTQVPSVETVNPTTP